MERSMELCRSILLKLAAHEHGRAPKDMTIEGYNEEQIGYHCYLLHQAELIHGLDVTSNGHLSPCFLPIQLTWAGHDFLDAAKTPSVWRAAMDKTFGVGLSVSTAVLKQLLESLIRDQLGLKVVA